MSYVYRHIRLDTNQPFYIGVGSDPIYYDRAKNRNRRSKYWYDITSKTDYKIDILMDNLSLEDALKKEEEFILLYGRIDLNTGTLCNKTNGGLGNNGYIPDETALSNMRKAQVKTNWDKEKKHKLGNWVKSLSKEELEKLKYKQDAGRHSHHIAAFYLDTNEKIGDFISIGKCAKYLNIHSSYVKRYLCGEIVNPINKNYHFIITKKT